MTSEYRAVLSHLPKQQHLDRAVVDEWNFSINPMMIEKDSMVRRRLSSMLLLRRYIKCRRRLSAWLTDRVTQDPLCLLNFRRHSRRRSLC